MLLLAVADCSPTSHRHHLATKDNPPSPQNMLVLSGMRAGGSYAREYNGKGAPCAELNQP